MKGLVRLHCGPAWQYTQLHNSTSCIVKIHMHVRLPNIKGVTIAYTFFAGFFHRETEMKLESESTYRIVQITTGAHAWIHLESVW